MNTGVPSASNLLFFGGFVIVGLVGLIGVVAVLMRSGANTVDHPTETPDSQRAAFTGATARLGSLSEVELRAELLRLLGRGNKIEAIKLLRQHSGLGLREAKDAVEALERNATAALPASTPAPPAPASSSSPDADPEVRRLLQSGNKIAAIKRVRELTGWGLKEAKDYVDRL